MSTGTRFLITAICLAVPYGFASLANQQLDLGYYLAGAATMLVMTAAMSWLANARSTGYSRAMSVLFTVTMMAAALLTYMASVTTWDVYTTGTSTLLIGVLVLLAAVLVVVAFVVPKKPANS